MRPEKWQRNAIFEAVTAGGLEVRECTFDYDEAGGRISHMPSGSYFLLEGDPGRYTTTAVVGESPTFPVQAFTWDTVKERVQLWSEDVKRDVETPDLWAELQGERELVSGAHYEEAENTPFTSDEQAEIAEQLRQIKELVKETYSLSGAQMRSLEVKLAYIEAAAGRMGRKDWTILFVSMILTALLPPDVVRHILRMALQGLAHLLETVAIPPQLPPLA